MISQTKLLDPCIVFNLRINHNCTVDINLDMPLQSLQRQIHLPEFDNRACWQKKRNSIDLLECLEIVALPFELIMGRSGIITTLPEAIQRCNHLG